MLVVNKIKVHLYRLIIFFGTDLLSPRHGNEQFYRPANYKRGDYEQYQTHYFIYTCDNYRFILLV